MKNGSTKRTISRVLAFVMLVSAMFTNMISANADVIGVSGTDDVISAASAVIDDIVDSDVEDLAAVPDDVAAATQILSYEDAAIGADDKLPYESTNSFFTVVGEVQNRLNSDKTAPNGIEILKDDTGSIQFTVTENSDVLLYLGSTSGSNSSDWAIKEVSAADNVEGGFGTVTGTEKNILTWKGNVPAGTYKIYSPDGTDNDRGVRVYYIGVTPAAGGDTEETTEAPSTPDTPSTGGEGGEVTELDYVADASSCYYFSSDLSDSAAATVEEADSANTVIAIGGNGKVQMYTGDVTLDVVFDLDKVSGAGEMFSIQQVKPESIGKITELGAVDKFYLGSDNAIHYGSQTGTVLGGTLNVGENTVSIRIKTADAAVASIAATNATVTINGVDTPIDLKSTSVAGIKFNKKAANTRTITIKSVTAKINGGSVTEPETQATTAAVVEPETQATTAAVVEPDTQATTTSSQGGDDTPSEGGEVTELDYVADASSCYYFSSDLSDPAAATVEEADSANTVIAIGGNGKVQMYTGDVTLDVVFDLDKVSGAGEIFSIQQVKPESIGKITELGAVDKFYLGSDNAIHYGSQTGTVLGGTLNVGENTVSIRIKTADAAVASIAATNATVTINGVDTPIDLKSTSVAGIKFNKKAANIRTITIKSVTAKINGGSVTEPETQVTTSAPAGDGEVNIVAEASAPSVKAGEKVKVTFKLSGNDATKGFNNYTMFVSYDPAVLKAVGAEDGTISMAAKDALGADITLTASNKDNILANIANKPAATDSDFPNADGSKTQAELGRIKVAHCIYDGNGFSAQDGSLTEYITDGELFTIEFEAVAAGKTDVNLEIATLNTVSSTLEIEGEIKGNVTPVSVEVTGSSQIEPDTQTTTGEPETEPPTETPVVDHGPVALKGSTVPVSDPVEIKGQANGGANTEFRFVDDEGNRVDVKPDGKITITADFDLSELPGEAGGSSFLVMQKYKDGGFASNSTDDIKNGEGAPANVKLKTSGDGVVTIDGEPVPEGESKSTVYGQLAPGSNHIEIVIDTTTGIAQIAINGAEPVESPVIKNMIGASFAGYKIQALKGTADITFKGGSWKIGADEPVPPAADHGPVADKNGTIPSADAPIEVKGQGNGGANTEFRFVDEEGNRVDVKPDGKITITADFDLSELPGEAGGSSFLVMQKYKDGGFESNSTDDIKNGEGAPANVKLKTSGDGVVTIDGEPVPEGESKSTVYGQLAPGSNHIEIVIDTTTGIAQIAINGAEPVESPVIKNMIGASFAGYKIQALKGTADITFKGGSWKIGADEPGPGPDVPDKFTIKADTVEVPVGTATATVNFKVYKNPGISGYNIKVDYSDSTASIIATDGATPDFTVDTDVTIPVKDQLAYVPAATDADYNGKANGTDNSAKIGILKYAAINVDANKAPADTNKEEAVVLSLTFDTSKAAVGTYPIKITDLGVRNAANAELTPDKIDGAIVIKTSGETPTEGTTAEQPTQGTTAEQPTQATTSAPTPSGGSGGGGGSGYKRPVVTTTEAAPEATTADTEKTEPVTKVVDNNVVGINPPTEQKPFDGFDDLGGYEWAKDAIDRLASLGIITGIGDRMFGPSLPCRRCDFAILINKALGLTVNATPKNFYDNVDTSKYYYNDVLIGYNAGILSGYGNNYFKPEQYCTREEMFVLVAKTLEYLGEDVTSTSQDVLNKYVDVADISWWSAPYCAFLTDAGIVTGTPGGYAEPDRLINRAEMAVMINKDYDYALEVLNRQMKTGTQANAELLDEAAEGSDAAEAATVEAAEEATEETTEADAEAATAEAEAEVTTEAAAE